MSEAHTSIYNFPLSSPKHQAVRGYVVQFLQNQASTAAGTLITHFSLHTAFHRLSTGNKKKRERRDETCKSGDAHVWALVRQRDYVVIADSVANKTSQDIYRV